jgi:hypothetical protein
VLEVRGVRDVGELSVKPDRAALLIAAGVAIVGAIAALHYARAGLTLSHYDARAHLVVSRRVTDSLMPGWQQVGAVWLPLPHLVNLIPVQIDYFYRTGAAAVAMSIASMAVAAWSIATSIHRTTGGWMGGALAAALLVLNPNVLYLQSTPMSEPLLFAMTFLAVALVGRWAASVQRVAGALVLPDRADTDPTTKAPGWALVGACLTRYEAWPITAALLGLAFTVLLRRGWRAPDAARAVRGLALWPLWTIAAFLVNSKITVGTWFVASGFFIAENESLGHPWLAWREVWRGLLLLAGPALPWLACAAAAFVVFTFARRKSLAAAIVPLALAAAAALPWYAYYKGHPLRVRYDVPLVAAAAAITGMGVALLPKRAAGVAAVAVLTVALWQARPLDANAPVVKESQRDTQNRIGRRAVTAYLADHWDRQPIMMSMGSLGHYMHDLSVNGFAIRDFLHEGTGELWKYALAHPRPYVEWIAVEEKAEGGDAIYWQGKHDPRFFEGYQRVAEGGGVALYRRIE